MSTNTDAPTGAVDAVRPPRPRTVQYAIYALAARGVFSVLAAWSLYGARGEVRTQLADANKTKGWTNADLNHNVDVVLRSSMLNAGIMIILLGLIAKFVWDGKSWARWAYLAVVLLIARDEYALIGAFGYHHWLPRILTTLTGLFGIGSLVLLFLRPSNAYFRPLAGPRPGLFSALMGSRTAPAGPADRPSLTKQPVGRPATPSRPAGTSGRTASSSRKQAAAKSTGPRGKSRQAGKRPGQR